MASARPQNPLIAIVGATGTGKSNLAVELAKRFNGEIINGDAMQMYTGLPIITNKIPDSERQGIPHHLLDRIQFDEQPWDVRTFRKEALRVVDDIHRRGKLPILVGGTHYYTQSLLFKDFLVDAESEKQNDTASEAESRWPILAAPPEEILAKLREVDPIMAKRWHPNEHRKIRRSLEIWLQTGRPASQVYQNQMKMNETLAATSEEDDQGTYLDQRSLRYPTIIFWLHAEREALKLRLDARVDKMVEKGLLKEAAYLHTVALQRKLGGFKDDTTRGIWVAIGYKEFSDYLNKFSRQFDRTEEADRAIEEAIEQMKTSTRQYSRRQSKFIRIRLIDYLSLSNALQRLYVLDCSDADCFSEKVRSPASDLTEAFLGGKILPDPKTISSIAREILTTAESGTADRDHSVISQTQTCDICDKVLETPKMWAYHLQSRKHRQKVATQNRAKKAIHGGHLETHSPVSWNGQDAASNAFLQESSASDSDRDVSQRLSPKCES
ncbi:MAG: hypothetical protein Q9227_006347 [Pyrenula ochraceoflavens]